MDPQLRQRLLGACVLVALAVLLIPVLLDGGYREPALNRRDLGPMPADDFPVQAPGVSAEATKAIDAGLDATPSQLAEGLETGNAEAGGMPPTSSAPTAASEPKSTKPPRAAATAVQPPTSRNPAPEARWAVQIAAFSARDKAESLVKRLQSAGAKAYIVEAREASGTLFRVRAGPLPERSAALALRDRLAANPEFRGSLVRE